MNFANKLPYIRDRLFECYFWILGIYFEAQYCRGRKIKKITSIIDDTYDAYETIDELAPFTDAIQS